MTDIDLRGYRTRLLDQGEGPPTVLVHGTPLDLGSWDPLVAELKGRRTIRYDVRGHGSAADVPVPGWTDLADDVIAVLDRLALADAHLVGHSWGAQIVQRAALDHPERVTRLSILCSRAAPFPSFHTVAAGLRAGTADRTASLSRWFDPDELSRPDPLVPIIRARLEDAVTEAWASALDMIADFDVLDDLHRIDVPVDVVAAGQDGVGDPEHMARIAAGVRHGELHVVDGAHHLLPLQRPDLVAAALKMG